MLSAWLIGMGIGALAEAGARAFRLWIYRRPHYRILNVLLMFGAVMGALSLQIASAGWITVLLAGFVIGLAYEWLNFIALRWWHFPDNRFLLFRGPLACAVSVAVLWAFVPLMIHGIRTLIAAA